MSILSNYQQFSGRHWESGSVHNVLSYQGVIAPHTNQPISEALLMGVSGGANFGYFLFDYDGYDPILSLITRNTFDPLETMLSRLGIQQEILHTNSQQKAVKNIIDILENGIAPLVWADMYMLPYNALGYDDGMWSMMPVVVYGYEDETVHIADRSMQGLSLDAETFEAARGRVKKDKFRVMTLSAPNWDKLESAVQKGLWQTITIFTEKPPKGSANSFGFKAYDHWIKMLTNTRNKKSWARFFPAGNRLYAALTSLQTWVMEWGTGNGFERDLYADFIDEAAIILNNDSLKEVSQIWRDSAEAWRQIPMIALPENVAFLGETRQLMQANHDLFINKGSQALDDIRANKTRLDEIKTSVVDGFPLSEEQVMSLQSDIADQVMTIRDIEQQAISAMQAAMNN